MPGRTRESELLVGALGKQLAAEARIGRETQGGIDVVEVHVRQSCNWIVTAGAHLVESDGTHPPVGFVVASAGVEHLMAPGQVLVHPPVGLRSFASLAEHLIALDPVDTVSVTYHPRSPLPQGGRKPRPPQVGRLDDVVIDGDDAGDLACSGVALVGTVGPDVLHGRSTQAVLSWVFSRTLSQPESRPKPLSFTPPKGTAQWILR